MTTLTAKVEGMTCGGCAASIERGLKKTGKVREVKVDLGAKTVRVEGEISAQELTDATTKLGFQVVEVR